MFSCKYFRGNINYFEYSLKMNHESNKQLWNGKALATVAGIGVGFFVAKYRSQIWRKIKILFNYKDPLRNQQVHIVSNIQECRKLMRNLKSHCNEYNVLGFDCEWVTVSGSRRPVALLQLASHSGLCALIRLSKLKSIPSELREILEDDNIVKVGVSPQGDAQFLARDYGICVASTFDLRHMAIMCGCRPGGLGKLSETILNVKLEKNWRIRCSDWEAVALSDKQIEYAAKDAHVAIEIFKILANRLLPQPIFGNKQKHLQKILNDYCFKFLDMNYHASADMNYHAENRQQFKPNGNLSDSVSADNFKAKKMATRQKPLYSNCLLQAPDGTMLSTCDDKKAMWYVKKEIGELISEDPLTVRLKFEPAGRAVGLTGKYYQTIKENQCVVCGVEQEYIRKNVIPREYRKYFPSIIKEHTSHDIVLLCPRCHQLSNLFDFRLRAKLAHECDAPFAEKGGTTKTNEVPQLKELKSVARALLFKRETIPEKRLTELRKRLKQLRPEIEEISDEILESYANIETTELNDNYIAHGAKVVEFFQKSELGLLGLEKMWREHFLETMKPKYLPSLWSVEHNAERLEIRADEGRIDINDAKLSGIFGTTNKQIKTKID